MKKKIIIILILTLFFQNIGTSQVISETQKKEILDEGIEIYKLYLSSQLATEVVLNNLNTKRRMEISDFLSYNSEGNYKAIYWKNLGKKALIYETVTFDKNINKNSLKHISDERLPTAYEFTLIKVKERVLQEMLSEPDFFKPKENESYHFIFHLTKSRKLKVYVLTIFEADEYIYLGKDYLITFKPNGKLITKEKFHSNSIKIPINIIVDESAKLQGTKHLHADENSPFINPTDICLLLINAHIVNWNKHYVMSQEYVSIFDIRTKKLNVLPRSFFED